MVSSPFWHVVIIHYDTLIRYRTMYGISFLVHPLENWHVVFLNVRDVIVVRGIVLYVFVSRDLSVLGRIIVGMCFYYQMWLF